MFWISDINILNNLKIPSIPQDDICNVKWSGMYREAHGVVEVRVVQGAVGSCVNISLVCFSKPHPPNTVGMPECPDKNHPLSGPSPPFPSSYPLQQWFLVPNSQGTQGDLYTGRWQQPWTPSSWYAWPPRTSPLPCSSPYLSCHAGGLPPILG